MTDKQTKRYWMSLRQRDGDEADLHAAGPEFAETPWTTPGPFSRRGFLMAAGFTFAGAMVSGCNRAPVRRAVPLLDQPEGVIPGRANYYASTCGGCPAGCGLLVKNRDGRPIKLEGNPDHPLSRGGLCAVGQASILGLYDSHRLRHPLLAGEKASWSKTDAAISTQLEAIRQEGGTVRFLTGTLASPTAGRMIHDFLQPFADARHVTYESLSCSAIAEAHARTNGVRLLPRYRFEKADVIASFDADFLGTWISPVEFTAGYQAGRQVEGESPRFLRHVQFESRFSLTGGKADQRFVMAPNELGWVLMHLAVLLAGHAGVAFDAKGLAASPAPMDALKALASELWHARQHSLVVSGSQDVAVQALCNFVNHLLDNYGHTLDIVNPSYQNQSNDAALEALLAELAEGKVKALFIHGVNPVFELPDGSVLADAIKRVPLVVSFAPRLDETSTLAGFVCPDHHYLESWGDHEATQGVVSFTQPTISPLGDTRSLIESLAAWSGRPRSARDILRQTWTDESFWDRTLHDGYASVDREPVAVQAFKAAAVRPIVTAAAPAAGVFSLVLYPKVGMRDGRHAYNPWLHELPDPISKATWDNYACLSPTAAGELGVSEGDVVEIQLPGQGPSTKTIELPVLIQMGQHDRVVAVALGYGAEESKRFARTGPTWLHDRPSVGENGLVGANAAVLLSREGGTLRYSDQHVRLSPTGKRHALALTQEHHTITVPEHLAPEGGLRRPNIQETTLAALHNPAIPQPHSHAQHEDLWPRDHEYAGHHWGMAIDLTACTGCAACVIACQVENNIPVVGKDEVRRNREMHWIRIDRYYAETDGGVDVAHQPMMCQHCDHAPCETVCPVLATVHSEEGLNQQTYNRCVGTRYCSNNCPYKVRRFNWFDYPHSDVLQNMTLNPDVTIRSRGVMEKCSMCVQRIQEAKIEAKRRGVALADGDIRLACQQSCPAGAIVFGDTNDPESRVSRLIAAGRHYRVLEEINVRPSVGYLSVVRNRLETEDSVDHG